MVEPSTSFPGTQAAVLGEYESQVTWLKGLEFWTAEKPAGIFLSNELVDAWPVRQVEAHNGSWQERYVDVNAQGALDWTLLPPDDELEVAIATLPLAPVEGYRTEIGLAAREWMREVGQFLRRGYTLTIDYGFSAAELYAPHRRAGTLTAYSKHAQAEDVLAAAGEQDITAHVDFTALARVGQKAGWTTLGLVDQQRLLTGILELDSGMVGPSDVRAFQTLTHPEYLGARLKALIHA